jgi:hypothetical protein
MTFWKRLEQYILRITTESNPTSLEFSRAFCTFCATEFPLRRMKSMGESAHEDPMKSSVLLWATIRRIGMEPILWVGGLLVLCLLGPSPEPHLRLCPFALSGIEFCPGCGLGRSIALLFRGEFFASFQAHWFGLPATAILLTRSLSLGLRNWKRTSGHNLHHL